MSKIAKKYLILKNLNINPSQIFYPRCVLHSFAWCHFQMMASLRSFVGSLARPQFWKMWIAFLAFLRFSCRRWWVTVQSMQPAMGTNGRKSHRLNLPHNSSVAIFDRQLIIRSVIGFTQITPGPVWPEKKLPNVYKSCPKMISLQKLKLLPPLQKLPKNEGDFWQNCCCQRL